MKRCARAVALARRVAATAALALLLPSAALAGPELTLEAQARATVANDEMVVVLAVERDGPQPGPPNEQVLRALEAALAEARAVEGVRARLGSVWTQPLPRADGRPQGWRVRGEVVLESTRVQELARLGGRLGERMQIASVQFRLSSARRLAEERRLLGEAAQAFRARAAEAAAAFGFQGFELRELALQPGGVPGPRPMMSARGGAAEAMAAPIPTDGGDSEVVMGVAGKVELRP